MYFLNDLPGKFEPETYLSQALSHAQNQPLFAPLITSENCSRRRPEHREFDPPQLSFGHLLVHLVDDLLDRRVNSE